MTAQSVQQQKKMKKKGQFQKKKFSNSKFSAQEAFAITNENKLKVIKSQIGKEMWEWENQSKL